MLEKLKGMIYARSREWARQKQISRQSELFNILLHRIVAANNYKKNC